MRKVEARVEGGPPRKEEALDNDIVEQVLGGQKARFGILVRRHNQRLFRIVRAILRNDDATEDVVQHAHVTAFHQLAQFRREASYATWLTRIAVNEAFGRLRRTKSLVSLESVGGEATMDTHTPADDAYRGELRRLLETHIDDLPDALRVVFVMREVEELGTAETAATLGITEAAVRVRLHRARALLQETLSQLMASAPDAFHFAGERCDRMTANVMAALGLDESV